MDPSPDSDVLLETVATSPHEDRKSRASRGESSLGHQTRNESQELLAVVTNTRHALRDAEQVAGATGLSNVQQNIAGNRLQATTGLTNIYGMNETQVNTTVGQILQNYQQTSL